MSVKPRTWKAAVSESEQPHGAITGWLYRPDDDIAEGFVAVEAEPILDLLEDVEIALRANRVSLADDVAALLHEHGRLGGASKSTNEETT